MPVATRKYNPGFLTDDELVESFCVRINEFDSMVEFLRECTGDSNSHQIVIGPRGSGKTSLLLRIAAETRRDAELSRTFFPIVFAEESYGVGTCGEFWLECLHRLSEQTPRREGDVDLRRSWEDLRIERDDYVLAERCLGILVNFADRAGKRLVLIVENLNMLLQGMTGAADGWRLRKTLQTEPSIVLLGSATSRFREIDSPDEALYDFFRSTTLRPMDVDECAVLWHRVSGKPPVRRNIRALQILTGGSPRLLMIVARFGRSYSFRNLIGSLLDLVDDHTDYFKSHLDALPPQERRVYVALADLWSPSTAKEVGEQARLETNKCSALLARLIERGAVSTMDSISRRKQYYLTERLYNIYYLLRRHGTNGRLVESLIQFMTAYYSGRELLRICDQIIAEHRDSDEAMKKLCYTAVRQLAQTPMVAEYCDVIPQLEKAVQELGKHGNPVNAIMLTSRILDGGRPMDPWLRAEVHIIRAKVFFLLCDIRAFDRDFATALAILPDSQPVLELGELVINTSMLASLYLGPAHVLDLIEASPSNALLLPLATALRWELGMKPKVAPEISEIAKDIQHDLTELKTRIALQLADMPTTK